VLPSTTEKIRHLGDATGLKNMQQLIQLRWFAVVGQIATIAVVHFGFGIALPLDRIGAVLACLVAFNLASLLRWRGRREVSNTELFVALLVDVATLTAQLYLSGGATNPFVFLYLLQVILGAVLLAPWSTWTMVALTCAAFAGVALLSPPLALPLDHDRGLASHYVQGMWICFALNAVLLAVFIKRITGNLRARDAHLADLRQRAAEEEHIVRMGLLASGAAHELGTPLATLSVILGDWRRMPAFSSNAELQQELGEMQAQLARCKRIVSGILLSAGEARGESSARTTVRAFLDELVAAWRATRPAIDFAFENRFDDDELPMVSDSALQQMIGNVLDNAAEASPRSIRFEAARQDDALVLTVTDTGPGFAPGMLAEFGKPYRSSKGRPGGGLGLFLVVNVARTLGGSVAARNRPEGGASVTITLPLASITLADEALDERA
jgi:two-component system, sensor histidine kinase RegB